MDWFKRHNVIIVVTLIMFVIFLLVTGALNKWGLNLISDQKAGHMSAVSEIDIFLTFFLAIATALLAFIAYHQIHSIGNTAKAEFLLDIDKQWTSEKITEVRVDLWKRYNSARSKTKNSTGCKDHNVAGCDPCGIKEVGKHILETHTKSKKEIKNERTEIELLFKYLNFMELMGAIYEMKDKGFIDKDLLDSLFGGKLETYIGFYKVYFEKKFPGHVKKGHLCKDSKCPPSVKLLNHFKKDK